MADIELLLNDYRYINGSDEVKKNALDKFFNKNVATDERFAPLDEAGKNKVYKNFLSKHYAPMQQYNKQRDALLAETKKAYH